MNLHIAFSYWKFLSKHSLGKWFFSYLIRFINPYTGNLGARVDVFEKGHVEVILNDKRRNRNHLNSVHAIALANLGEFCSGLAVLGSLPHGVRGIVTELSAQYLQKARGELRAICHTQLPEVKEEMAYEVEAEIFNSENERVCLVHVTWQLGLVESKEAK